ncbi:hypothetical protein J132_05288, partial [Termitomyces sp. J132]
RIHPKFHVLLLHQYKDSDDALFPNREMLEPYDFGTPDDQEWFVDDLVDHCWDSKNLKFKVHWSLGDTTWESLETCKDLVALDRDLELQNVQCTVQLARRSKLA